VYTITYRENDVMDVYAFVFEGYRQAKDYLTGMGFKKEGIIMVRDNTCAYIIKREIHSN
jgi:hypothetical protein